VCCIATPTGQLTRRLLYRMLHQHLLLRLGNCGLCAALCAASQELHKSGAFNVCALLCCWLIRPALLRALILPMLASNPTDLAHQSSMMISQGFSLSTLNASVLFYCFIVLLFRALTLRSVSRSPSLPLAAGCRLLLLPSIKLSCSERDKGTCKTFDRMTATCSGSAPSPGKAEVPGAEFQGE
jgi:hypothetical protein